MRCTLLMTAAASVISLPLTAQDLAHRSAVGWQPETPNQGALIWVVVTPPTEVDDAAVAGSLAGQTLHFGRDGTGRYRALAPIPVNAAPTILFSFTLVHNRDSSHRVVRIPVDRTTFRQSRLSVDSRFTRAPDSALAARIARERRRSATVSRNTHETPRQWRGAWVRPRPGPVTSEFGVQRMFNGQLRSRHLGVDFDGDVGDSVVAANRGIVALVGDFYYAGNVVYLDHGRGLITIYMHLSEVEVEEGQVVERGELIGRVGATGRVTGPHVHWTARYGRISVDGLSLFDLELVDRDPPLGATR